MSDPSMPPADTPASTGAGLTDWAGVGVGVSNVLIADLIGVNTTAGKALLLLVPVVTYSSQKLVNGFQTRAESKRKKREQTEIVAEISLMCARVEGDPTASTEHKEIFRQAREAIDKGILAQKVKKAIDSGAISLDETSPLAQLRETAGQVALTE